MTLAFRHFHVSASPTWGVFSPTRIRNYCTIEQGYIVLASRLGGCRVLGVRMVPSRPWKNRAPTMVTYATSG